ncbi:MAG TPA: hypothetical protein VFO27_09605 [Bryobacteraceae bacterium]|nr:hypothetical protein [Bryobacteraceae bacterium]
MTPTNDAGKTDNPPPIEAALSAAAKVVACVRSYDAMAAVQDIFPPNEVLAHIIRTEFAPAITALREIANTRDETIREAPRLWLGQCVSQARSALDALGVPYAG